MASFRDAVVRPGRVGLIYFGVSLWLFHARVTKTSSLTVGDAQTMVIWPWILCGLPLVGAAAAWRSRRAGGSRSQRLAAAVFPVVVPALVLSVTTSADLLRATCGPPSECLQVAAAHWLAWMILPGVALAAGALPFLREAAAPSQRDA